MGLEAIRIDYDVVAAGETSPNTPFTKDYEIDAAYDIISIYVTPKDVAETADDSNVDIMYQMQDGSFYDLSGATGGTASINQIFPYSTENAIQFIRVEVTPGTTKPDDGYIIEVWGKR